jgi:hypothetical protein
MGVSTNAKIIPRADLPSSKSFIVQYIPKGVTMKKSKQTTAKKIMVKKVFISFSSLSFVMLL